MIKEAYALNRGASALRTVFVERTGSRTGRSRIRLTVVDFEKGRTLEALLTPREAHDLGRKLMELGEPPREGEGA